MTTHDHPTVEQHVAEFAERELAVFREARSLWQLTPDGREIHQDYLAADLDGFDLSLLADVYRGFLDLNHEFKELCGAWQLRDGVPNDHLDVDYDAEVVDRLAGLHHRAEPVVGAFGDALERFVPYGWRLDAVLDRIRIGESNMFTGVMCGSYHDVWMELHEDLILTLGIDRAAEGSY